MDSAAEARLTPELAQSEWPQQRDADLARRIARGDLLAWEAFFHQYAPWAYRFAYHHLSANQADAEDLCSEIMMAAARAIGGYNPGRGSLDVWLLGVARHRLARFCRRRRIETPVVPNLNGDEPDDGFVAVDRQMDNALEREMVNRALASLPERQAAVLVGKYVSGHSVGELAGQMDSTPKAIESLLSRARAAFRAAFSALLADGSGGESGG
jgi:RNA polymerase sigma-70 factor (ECF subfamily)